MSGETVTSAWCEEKAALWERHAKQMADTLDVTPDGDYARISAALRIASRVLAEDAVEGVARVLHRCDEPGELEDANESQQRYCRNAARAVLSLLRGQEGQGSSRADIAGREGGR